MSLKQTGTLYNEVFISYSRKDKDFAQKVVKAIYASGRENIWVDWEDIEYAEDWWEKIQAGINSADNFIFILTPNSVNSEVCYNEVDYAVQSGKRIIPVVHIPVTEKEDFEKMHPIISSHNWLPFEQDAEFDAGMRMLLQTIETDMAHTRFHTRLQTRAREWEGKAKNEAYLLSTGELIEAQSWLAKARVEEKSPAPTQLQSNYIAASQVAEDERQAEQARIARRVQNFQRASIGLGVVAVIAVVATVAAIFISMQASQNATSAQETAVAFAYDASTNEAAALEFVNEAATAQEEAVAYANEASTNEADALVAAETAFIAQEEAVAFANEASTSEADAVAFVNTAAAAQGTAVADVENAQTQVAEANIANTQSAVLREEAEDYASSVQLASRAQDIYNSGNQPLGLKLAYEASLLDTPLQTQRILNELAYQPSARRSFDLGDGFAATSVDFSPNGQIFLSDSFGEIVLWDVETGEDIGSFYRTSNFNVFNTVVFSPDGQTILMDSCPESDDNFNCSGSELWLWDIESQEVVRSFVGHAGEITSVAMNADGTRIVSSGCVDRTENYECMGLELFLWDAETGELINTFEGHSDEIKVAISPDGEQIISVSWDEMFLWDSNTGEIIQEFNPDSGVLPINVAFSPDGQHVLSIDWDNNLLLWDIESNKLVRRFEGHYDQVNDIVFSADGQRILSGAYDSTVILWNVETGEIIRHYEGHTDDVNTVAISSDGTQLLSGSWDYSVLLWDVQSADVIYQLEPEGGPNRVTYSPNGQYILSGSWGGNIDLWNVETGEQTKTFSSQGGDNVYDLAFSPNGQFILSSTCLERDDSFNCVDSTLFLWNVESGKLMKSVEGQEGTITSIAFSPNGQFILSASCVKGGSYGSCESSEILLRDLETEEIIQSFEGAGNADNVAFSPNGQYILSSTGEYEIGILYLWDIETGELIRSFEGHEGNVKSAVFSPDGKYILSGGGTFSKFELFLWDVETGEIVQRFEGHSDWINSVAFGSDGQTILSGSEDNTVILWDVATGEVIRRFAGHEKRISAVAFSPDGQSLLSSSDDGSIKLWRNNNLEQLQDWINENRYLPELNCSQRVAYGLPPC